VGKKGEREKKKVIWQFNTLPKLMTTKKDHE
jgi:hypothetical protein